MRLHPQMGAIAPGMAPTSGAQAHSRAGGQGWHIGQHSSRSVAAQPHPPGVDEGQPPVDPGRRHPPTGGRPRFLLATRQVEHTDFPAPFSGKGQICQSPSVRAVGRLKRVPAQPGGWTAPDVHCPKFAESLARGPIPDHRSPAVDQHRPAVRRPAGEARAPVSGEGPGVARAVRLCVHESRLTARCERTQQQQRSQRRQAGGEQSVPRAS